VKLYAWVGEDESHDGEGIKMIMTPLGGASAVFAKERLALSPFVLNQIQQIATVLNRPMRLITVEETVCLKTITPNPQG
jgi:hypothetical protein